MESAGVENRLNNFIDRFGRSFTEWIVRNVEIIVTVLIFLPVLGFGIEPVLRTSGFVGIADAIRSVYSINCHQIPSRCPVIWGQPAILCHRCLGFYSGLIIGWLLVHFREFDILRRKIVLLILIPAGLNLLDIIGIGMGLWDWGGLVRYALGLIAGTGPAYLLVRGVRSLPYRSRAVHRPR